MSNVFYTDDPDEEDTHEIVTEPEALPVDADGWIRYYLGGPYAQGEPCEVTS